MAHGQYSDMLKSHKHTTGSNCLIYYGKGRIKYKHIICWEAGCFTLYCDFTKKPMKNII